MIKAYKIAAICSSAMDKVLTRTIFLRELLLLTNPLKEKNMVELGGIEPPTSTLPV